MMHFQNLLSKNAELFINQFLDTDFIDYHIAVTTSSPSLLASRNHFPQGTGGGATQNTNAALRIYGGELARCKELAEELGYDYPNYVDRNTPAGYECLKEMMNVGNLSPTEETFFNIPMMVLSGKKLEENSGFYRPNAHLAIFVLTDSYDQSELTPQESYDFLLRLKQGDEKKIHYAAGIIAFQITQYVCLREQRPVWPTTDFTEMVRLFENRGYQFNLCQFNYGKNLAQFASHLVDSALTIPLDYVPDTDTIKVHYENEGSIQMIPNNQNGWIYDPKSNTVNLSPNIRLEKIGGKFKVDYETLYITE